MEHESIGIKVLDQILKVIEERKRELEDDGVLTRERLLRSLAWTDSGYIADKLGVSRQTAWRYAKFLEALASYILEAR